jgi:hypothetical protein
MKTSLTASNGYVITTEKIHGLGLTWIVRVHRRKFLFSRRISSDWFLDAEQARKFADQLHRDLSGKGSGEQVRNRKPGWTLHRPAH